MWLYIYCLNIYIWCLNIFSFAPIQSERWICVQIPQNYMHVLLNISTWCLNIFSFSSNQSNEWIRVRIQQMEPDLMDVGSTLEDARALRQEHDELLMKLNVSTTTDLLAVHWQHDHWWTKIRKLHNHGIVVVNVKWNSCYVALHSAHLYLVTQ